VLLLDEPTNHLDLEMRRSLAMALQGYVGALVIVSHDRHLIATCADRILVVAGGRVVEFDGDLDDYRQLRLKEERGRRPEKDRASRKDDRRAVAESRAELRQRLKPLVKKLAEIEARVTTLTKEVESARAALADPALYTAPEPQRLEALMRSEAQLSAELANAEEDWLHASARIEGLKTELEDARPPQS
jgi:ATP-binding cassette, subfamily F, member 3